VTSNSSSGKGRKAAVLEAPPKLCFELLKERDLKAKLSGLGLSNEGTKKVGSGDAQLFQSAAAIFFQLC
jgi:hypothetical protein